MKKLVVLLVLAVTACTSVKQGKKEADFNTLSLTYSAITRGSYNKVAIENKKITTTTKQAEEKVTTRQLTDAEWKAITDEYSTLAVKDNDLRNINVPSTRHQFDGALSAQLAIAHTNSGAVFESPTFDHGNPPEEIAALVGKILELSELKKTE